MKIDISPQKTLFGKKTGRYVAKLGNWTKEGSTREEAAQRLEQELAELEKYEHHRRYLQAKDGAVFALRHCFSSWSYDIVRGDQHSTCLMAADNSEDAFAKMKKHFDQYNSN